MAPLYFEEKGTGFPVLLIHGFCETHAVWNKVRDKLSVSYRVLSIDLPGFGQSPLPSPPSFCLNDIAGRIINWLTEKHIKRCVVLGHSLGGYITLAIARQQPELLAGFGLLHSTAYADTQEKKANRNRVIEFVKQHGVKPFIESFIPPLFANPADPGIMPMIALGLTTSSETLIAYTRAMRDRPDQTDVLSHYGGGVLFLAGEKDGLIPVESITAQVKLCKHPTVTVLEGVGHMGMLEATEKTVQSVKAFLAGIT